MSLNCYISELIILEAMSRYDIDTVDLLKLIFKLSRSDFDFSIYLHISGF